MKVLTLSPGAIHLLKRGLRTWERIKRLLLKWHCIASRLIWDGKGRELDRDVWGPKVLPWPPLVSPYPTPLWPALVRCASTTCMLHDIHDTNFCRAHLAGMPLSRTLPVLGKVQLRRAPPSSKHRESQSHLVMQVLEELRKQMRWQGREPFPPVMVWMYVPSQIHVEL